MNQRQLFLRHVAQTSPTPLSVEIKNASGMYMYTPENRPIMDLISGIGVSSLGHCHPAVVKAVQKQAATYMHTMVYGEFILAPQVALAKLLTQQLPSSLNSVYFVNSGSEAVEGALKLAKKVTGRYNIVAAKQAYHGSSHGSVSLMDEPYFTRAYRPLLPNVRYIRFNEQKDLIHINETTACAILETVQGEKGLFAPLNGYLSAVRNRCDEVGALLILDEIQAGYGRTGSLFAFEQFEVIPDILLLAKGMGGGMPIGAFVADKEYMDQLATDPILGHITTFGGHPVNAAAGLATLKELLNSDLIQQVNFKNQRFLEHLSHPAIKEIRHCGLWFALDLGDPALVWKAVQLGIEHGLLFDWFLFNTNSIRISPPLIISEGEIIKACRLLHEILDACK